MKEKNDATEFSPDETARRRDEVIRRMANTPPQPRVKSPTRSSKKGKPTGRDGKARGAGKDQA